MIEVKEQCKKCFHFQVCAEVLKQQLFMREVMLKEENPKCDYFVPVADVVQVVKCKDCKHYIAGFCTRDINGRTNMFRMGEDDFCSYGERKAE